MRGDRERLRGPRSIKSSGREGIAWPDGNEACGKAEEKSVELGRSGADEESQVMKEGV